MCVCLSIPSSNINASDFIHVNPGEISLVIRRQKTSKSTGTVHATAPEPVRQLLMIWMKKYRVYIEKELGVESLSVFLNQASFELADGL